MKFEYGCFYHGNEEISDTLLSDCADLFSNHYGRWSANASKNIPYEPIQHSANRIFKLIESKDSLITTARFQGKLIAYAAAIHTQVPNRGIISWVTQLVVHKDYRNRGIATELLFSIWTFTDNFAWGLVTASPYAVRALEKATRRRVIPSVISDCYTVLLDAGSVHIPYISAKTTTIVNKDVSKINTEFFVDHSDVPNSIKNVSKIEPWQLGELEEGWEWFAFTFQQQKQISLTSEEIQKMLNAVDESTKQAYSRMTMDESHKWSTYVSGESKFIEAHCKICPGQNVLDIGCGIGRHVIELASQGFNTTGIDYLQENIDSATKTATERNLPNAHFIHADCRDLQLETTFDSVICMYDVIGTYADNQQNIKILQTIVSCLKPGGYTLISVMNMELTEHIAKNRFSMSQEPDKLLSLPASHTMEQTGDIFDPDYFIVDMDENIIYRKEKFGTGGSLPAEILVRDRRFKKQEIENMCCQVGLNVVWSRFVRAGEWNTPLLATNPKAKEILILCTRSDT